MNQKQLVWMWLCVGTIIAMLAFPPWVHTFNYESVQHELAMGYSFIGNPPHEDARNENFGLQVDLRRLAVQVFGVVLAGAGLMVSCHSRE